MVGSRITTATATTGTQAAVTTGTQAAVATATAATTAVTATTINGNGNMETRQPRDLPHKLTCCPWVQHDLVYEGRHGIGRGQDLHGRRPDLDA
ncbi:MAG: hypothetical protein ACOVQL_05925 [Limnohabitans sp.]